MTKTKKNPYKEQREWTDLLHEKKSHILKRHQDEDAIRQIREQEDSPEEQEDHPPF